MGFDAGHLVFWKPKSADLSDPAALVQSLDDGKMDEQLNDLDVDSLLSALKETYRKFKLPQPVELDFPRQETAITITWSTKHFSFFFEGNAFKQMDCVSLLMSKHGLACYDVLWKKSFTADAPQRFVESDDEEARQKIVGKLLQERCNAILADMGYPYDPKLKLSPGLRDLFQNDRERGRIVQEEYWRRIKPITELPEFWHEVDRRMSLRSERLRKKAEKESRNAK